MVERTIGVYENLPALAANVFKLRHESREIAGWQGKQSRLRGQFDKAFTLLNRIRFALVPRGSKLGVPERASPFPRRSWSGQARRLNESAYVRYGHKRSLVGQTDRNILRIRRSTITKNAEFTPAACGYLAAARRRRRISIGSPPKLCGPWFNLTALTASHCSSLPHPRKPTRSEDPLPGFLRSYGEGGRGCNLRPLI
jgi:hypothetical protein